MRTTSRAAAPGLTAIELLIVIAIIGVLVAVVLPNLQWALQSARREDAIGSLRELHNIMQQYYTANGTFATATIAQGTISDVLSSAVTDDGHYTLSISTVSATTFTIKATRQGGSPQIRDTQCGDYTLTSANVRGITGTGSVDQCW